MGYRYYVKLYPELLKTRDGLDLSTTLEEVRKTAEMYNTVGVTAANRKSIEMDSIRIENGNTLELILESDAWLQFPTKALRYFISKLSKTYPYSALITNNGRLFKGESMVLEQKEKDITEEQQISDEEALIAVTRLFFRENEENREKINKIKDVLRGGKKDV